MRCGDGLRGAHCAFSSPRTLTQDDPGDNQITLEEITQMVRRACPLAHRPSLSPPASPPHDPQGSTVTPVVVCWAVVTKYPRQIKTTEFCSSPGGQESGI